VKILVAGQKEFGAAAFRLALRLGHEVVAVSCPARNTRGDAPDGLGAVAKTHGVERIGRLDAASVPEGVDLIVTAHSHDFISAGARNRSRWGAVGYHPSLLPRHRGRDAVKWTIKMGDAVAGGSVYWLNEVMDGGPVAAQEWCWVEPGETPQSLWREKLFPMGLMLLERVLSDVMGHFVGKKPQSENVATFEPACNPPRAYRPDLLRIGESTSGKAAIGAPQAAGGRARWEAPTRKQP